MLASPVPEAEIPISARYDSRGLDLYHCLVWKTRAFFRAPFLQEHRVFQRQRRGAVGDDRTLKLCPRSATQHGLQIRLAPACLSDYMARKLCQE